MWRVATTTRRNWVGLLGGRLNAVASGSEAAAIGLGVEGGTWTPMARAGTRLSSAASLGRLGRGCGCAAGSSLSKGLGGGGELVRMWGCQSQERLVRFQRRTFCSDDDDTSLEGMSVSSSDVSLHRVDDQPHVVAEEVISTETAAVDVKKKKGRKKKSEAAEAEAGVVGEETPEKKVRKPRKTKAKEAVEESAVLESSAESEAKPKRTRKKKAAEEEVSTTADTDAPTKTKKSAVAKVVNESEKVIESQLEVNETKSTEAPDEIFEATPVELEEVATVNSVYYKLTEAPLSIEGVTIVQSKKIGEEVVKKLMQLTHVYHACDTEVIDIDLSEVSPVGHGKVICFSIFCGNEYDFGNGPRIWVDTYYSPSLFEVFKPYFENSNIKKVWHNYSFDRHVLYNHDVNCLGLGGDTIHMARLWDSGRMGFSLEALSTDLLERRKSTITDRFAKPKIKKDGTEIMETPPLEVLQTSGSTVIDWIDYSTYDTEATWKLRNVLEEKLRAMPWNSTKNMWDFYLDNWLPFGELLTDMERFGIKVDVEYLQQVEPKARAESEDLKQEFVNWASAYCEDAAYMNISSDKQLQQFFFAPFQDSLPEEKSFKIEKEMVEEMKAKAAAEAAATDDNTPPESDAKSKGKKEKSNVKKELVIRGIGLPVIKTTAAGLPAVSGEVLRALAGSPNDKEYGVAFESFGGGADGIAACEAIATLVQRNAIETLLNTFIVPLQHSVDQNGRIHASLNLNTETGRLSCRKPNLQNQPALEKDRYKIRKCFTCEPNNLMIAADYGQLELRLLAIITNCKSMIEAFKKGGDFHSRTAIGMYDYVRKAVESEAVLLEWDTKKNGPPPKPLLKDVYAVERRRAKVLNFSIAYGKTAAGLAKDWNVTVREAQNILDLWYSDRPEVKRWQEETIRIARDQGVTRTMLGRYRTLHGIKDGSRALKNHLERAAINTPLQGGAADVVMKAMLKIQENQRLKELGWKMMLQIHDELLFEGPKETVDEAYKIIVDIMRNPLNKQLSVDLVVDAKIGRNWYECK